MAGGKYTELRFNVGESATSAIKSTLLLPRLECRSCAPRQLAQNTAREGSRAAPGEANLWGGACRQVAVAREPSSVPSTLARARQSNSARPPCGAGNWWSTDQSVEAGGWGGAGSVSGKAFPLPPLPHFRVTVLVGNAGRVASFPLPAVCSWGNRGRLQLPLVLPLL